jgi:hypothetical protein
MKGKRSELLFNKHNTFFSYRWTNDIFTGFQVKSESYEIFFPKKTWQVAVHSVPPGSVGSLNI